VNAATEAKKIAFDRIGNGEKVLLISGFPQTRLSWSRLVPLLSQKFQTIPADLPSFGESGILSAPATTENVARVFHEFVANLDPPLHVVAHDFGAWVAYSWALLFKDDFRSLTLIDAGIPGVTLTDDIQPSDSEEFANPAIVPIAREDTALTGRRPNSQRVPPRRHRPGRLFCGRPIVRRGSYRQRLAGGAHRLVHQAGRPARAKDDGWCLDRHDVSVPACWSAERHGET
jgi:pimeloyl-ACP methyl ester carboxylesterase